MYKFFLDSLLVGISIIGILSTFYWKRVQKVKSEFAIGKGEGIMTTLERIWYFFLLTTALCIGIVLIRT